MNSVKIYQESRMTCLGCFYQKISPKMGCYVRGGRNDIGCFVGMAEMAWDVMSRVTKKHGMFCPGWQIFVGCFAWVSENGMGCFVLG